MFSMLGYNQDEILKILIEHKNKELKMTREEAVIKIKRFKYNPEFLNMLEALGLLKFEEKEEVKVKLCSASGDFDGIKEVKIEWLPDIGIQLLVDDEIEWKSWENKASINDEVIIIQNNGIAARGRLREIIK